MNDNDNGTAATVALALNELFGTRALQVASSQASLAKDENLFMWKAVVMALTKSMIST